MKPIQKIVLLTFLIAFLASTANAQTIYIKPLEALKAIFKDSEEIISQKISLTPEQINEIEKKLGYQLSKKEWSVFIARSKNEADGYGIIDNELGKTEPITFLTTLTPEGKVRAVEILVYREPYGSEVHQKSFLKQYLNKNSADHLTVGQDIQAISGATISSSSVTKGVKRDLILWDAIYGKR